MFHSMLQPSKFGCDNSSYLLVWTLLYEEIEENLECLLWDEQYWLSFSSKARSCNLCWMQLQRCPENPLIRVSSPSSGKSYHSYQIFSFDFSFNNLNRNLVFQNNFKGISVLAWSGNFYLLCLLYLCCLGYS